jgi:signal recognition particle GTPase
MVKAIIDIDEEANRVINILKAQRGLRDKSQAINEMARQFKELVLDSDVRPEYVLKFRKIRKEPIIRVGRVKDFKGRYQLK